jgi:hypothetical protein
MMPERGKMGLAQKDFGVQEGVGRAGEGRPEEGVQLAKLLMRKG